MNPAPIVTKRMIDHPADSHRIDVYEDAGGYAQARRALGMTRDELVDTVKASGLLGRGGAALQSRPGRRWARRSGRPSGRARCRDGHDR